jgi:uncharacterized SAM-binding protein YcdF (DUF218 family)
VEEDAATTAPALTAPARRASVAGEAAPAASPTMPPLSALLPPLVLPLGLALILGALGLALRRRWLVAAALAGLWLASIPPVASALARAVEGGQVRTAAADAPSADAIVVLSSRRVLAPGEARISEWVDADRFFGGLELFDARKAPRLVFTGGWSPRAPDRPPEGEVLARWAERWGVPPEAILVTDRVTNTAEEAAAVAALLAPLGVDRVLLVTSAFHVPRARALFERAGLRVEAFPVDFQVGDGRRWSLTDALPRADALRLSEQALREWLGRLAYRAW